MLMRKLLIVSVMLLFPAFVSPSARAQTDEHRFEVGGLFTTINLQEFSVPGSSANDEITLVSGRVNGIGGRLGYNLTKNFAVEGEASFFPSSRLGNDQLGQKAQAFLGVRAGARTRRFGLFAKARPGVMFVGEVTTSLGCREGQLGSVCRPKHNAFAFDVGAVAELYPTGRTILRLDLGDTITRLKQTTGGILSPVRTTVETTNNFQASVGFGFRF